MADDDKSTSQQTDEEEQLDEASSGTQGSSDGTQDSDEESTEEVEEEQVEETPEASQAEDKTEEPDKPSRRENLRIRQLVSKMQQQAPQAPQPRGLDYREALDADDEVINQLEADRRTYGESAYTQGVREAEALQFHTRLEIDAPKVESKYPQLDKDSPDFNPAVADAINSWYLATAGYNPNTNTVSNSRVRYADFVEGIMELANEAAGEKVARSSKNIARQASTTGLRPDGSSAKRLDLNKAPENMTDEELDAVISQAIPKK